MLGFSTDYIKLNTMPTVTVASNAKVMPNPNLVPDPAVVENSNPVHPYCIACVCWATCEMNRAGEKICTICSFSYFFDMLAFENFI